MPETPDLESLIGTLQGTIGRSPMQSLSPLGQFGAALAGFGAGVQGRENPVLAQIQGQQDAQIRQQVQMMQLQQSVQRHRMEQSKLLNDLSDQMLKSPDQAVQSFGAKTKGDVLKQLGLNPSPNVISGLANRTLDEKEMQRAGRYLEYFKGDVKRASELSGVPLPVVQELSQGRTSEAYSTLVYGKSLAQRKKESVDLEKSTYEVWSKTHPMLPAVEAEASLLASEKFPGQTLQSLVDDDRAAILRLAQKQVTAREIEKERRKQQDAIELAKTKANFAALKTHLENQQVATLATHGIRLLDRKGNEYAGDPLALAGDVIARGYEPVKDHMAKDLRAGKQSFRIFGNMRAQAAVLAQKGLLAKAADAYEQTAKASPDYAAAQGGDPGAMDRLAMYVKFNINKFTREPDILTWAGMESEMIISLRNLGEKGIRAMQGFAGAVGVMKGGQFDAIDHYIRNLELITVAQFDEKWTPAFETKYIAQNRKNKQTGTLSLRPGEAFDLGQYQIMTEFSAPAQ